MPDALSVIRADITRIEVDAVVNAANEWMLGGGGVDGAIHFAAGPELLEACRAIPEVRPGVRCPVAEARITPGFRLPAKYIIHTVGPRWHGGERGESALLAACYKACLSLAHDRQIRTIAFPAISTGAFAYPPVAAARIAAEECVSFLKRGTSVSRIVLVGFSNQDVSILRRAVDGARRVNPLA